MIKLLTAKAFSTVIEIDEAGKIINVPPFLSQFINQPLSILEKVLRKNQIQSIIIEDVEDVQ
jgi:hypothetical protein